MDAILRIIDQNGIQDWDLSAQTVPVSVLQFYAAPSDHGWSYRCTAPLANGNQPISGAIRIGDVFFLDAATRTKVMILPKITGQRKTIQFTNQLTVGRRSGSDLRLQHGTVSSGHCVFCVRDGVLYVQDMGSTNGTYRNDKPVESNRPTRLQKGDAIKIGPYLLGVSETLFIQNADDNVIFSPSPATAKSSHSTDSAVSHEYAKPHARSYPWFSRAPRLYEEVPSLSIEIEAAPAIGEKPSMGMGAIAMSVPAMAISLGMTALRYGLGRRKYSQKEKQRAEIYAKYLTGIENQLQTHAEQQRALALRVHPDTKSCIQRVDGPAPDLWERHPDDEDFLHIRLGLGTELSTAHVTIPTQRLQLQEDEFARVPEQIKTKYAKVDQMPAYCDMRKDGICGILGSRAQSVQLAQAMVAQIAALHSYDEVKLVVFYPKGEAAQWEWMRWLPHCMNAERDLRYIACDKIGAREILPALEAIVKDRTNDVNDWKFGAKHSNLPHYIFVVADPSLLADSTIGNAMMMNQPDLGINGIILGQTASDFPYSIRNVIRVASAGNGIKLVFRCNADTRELTTREMDIPNSIYSVFARKMAPIRLSMTAGTGQKNLPNFVTFFDGLHIRDVDRLELDDYWNNARPEVSMAVPIGIKNGGDLFYFDIHEKAQGPHGIIAGGTGSGKSKLVQSWIAAMVLQFSPQDVNFVLVDFKGESLLKPFKGLPHLAGFTSNIDPDVRRKFLSVESEMTRRMVLLKEFSCDDIIQYRKKRNQAPQMPLMPYLVLVVDEYADFKTQYPEFTAPIDHLYQAGRSLGMYAILMTQKPSGKITEQMRANLGFRWCLRVDDEMDSREILGNSDAAHIRSAGRAYVKANDGTYALIQSLYGHSPYTPNKSEKRNNAQVFALKLNGRAIEDHNTWSEDEAHGTPIELEVLTAHLIDHCRRNRIPHARPIWQEAIPERLDLEQMYSQLEARNAENNAESIEHSHPVAVIGLYDDPAHQIQEVLTHDFWEDGNLAVYGMPKSGKSTFLQTVILSLCSRYTPEQVQFYLLESGGFGMRNLERFPHVGAAAGNDESERAMKVIRFLTEELDRRRKLFRMAGVTTLESYLEVADEPVASILLVVDHLNDLGKEFPDLQAQISKMAASGPAYGIFLICSFSGTTGVNYQLTQNIGRVMALKLADKMDYTSLVGRITVDPAALPVGRGFQKTGAGSLMFQTAAAFVDQSDSKRSVLIRHLADRLQEDWHGVLPVSIQCVPEEIPYGSLIGEKYLLGMNMEDASTISLPLFDYQSLMVGFGGEDSAAFLYRSLIRQTAEAGGEVWMYTKSPGRYEDLLDKEHLLSELPKLDQLAEPLADALRERQGKYKADSSVAFPPILVLVDGMKEILTQAEENTVMRLEVFVRLGRGLGFFLVCGDMAADMNYCRYSGSSILAVTMRTRARMIVGGSLSEHQLFDNASLRSAHPGPLKTDEAVLLRSEQEKAVFIKIMRGDP